jgi:phosphate starvation-inducible protein PhoH and related proteins
MATVTQLFDASALSNAELAHLCGPMDENLRQIEAGLDVAIARRGPQLTVRGTGITTTKRSSCLSALSPCPAGPLTWKKSSWP